VLRSGSPSTVTKRFGVFVRFRAPRLVDPAGALNSFYGEGWARINIGAT
jgi:hypothetical protein